MTEVERVTTDVCAVDELPDGDVAVVELPGVGRVAVFNAGGELFGLEDQCSHQQAWLSDGFLEGCAVECPVHASRFDLRTGKPNGPPAKDAVRTFAVGTVAGRVVLLGEEAW
jgi:3-phenylpropionate/trans-cinnamate dioxygenase ferredoxin subunit